MADSKQNVESAPFLVLNGMALINPYVGQGVYTLRLIEGLVRRGSDFLVVAPSSIPRPCQLPEKHFLHMPSFRSPKNSLLSLAVASERMLRFVRREFPHSIFHSPGPTSGWITPERTVVTMHDCLYRHFSNYNGRFFIRRYLSRRAERFAAGARLVLTDSEYSRSDLITRTKIPPAKIKVLNPWVGQEFLEPIPPAAVARLRTQLELPDRFWLYVGGYDYRKNVNFLLDAYAEADRRKALPPLVLAGNLPVKRHVALCDVRGALERNQLSPGKIISVGLVGASDLPVLNRAASLLIFPSLGEGFGLTPAEAIATGCPVLSSNVTSLPEIVHNGDSLFDPRDLPSLVRKMLAAADNEALFSNSLSPAFTESHGINRYLQLISELA